MATSVRNVRRMRPSFDSFKCVLLTFQKGMYSKKYLHRVGISLNCANKPERIGTVTEECDPNFGHSKNKE